MKGGQQPSLCPDLCLVKPDDGIPIRWNPDVYPRPSNTSCVSVDGPNLISIAMSELLPRPSELVQDPGDVENSLSFDEALAVEHPPEFVNNELPSTSRRPLSANGLNYRSSSIQHPQVSQEKVQRLLEKRLHLLGTRMKFDEARSSLRQQNSALKDMDAVFISKLRKLFFSHLNELQALFHDFDALQEARNNIQQAEDELEQLEQEVIREEWELNELETIFYRRNISTRASLRSEPESDFRELPVEEVDSDDTASTISKQAELSPQVTRYLSRMGDADLSRERLADLRTQRARLVDEERLRARVGRRLDQDSLDFLANFDFHHKTLMDELTVIELDIARLKDLMNNNDDYFFSLTLDKSDQQPQSPSAMENDPDSETIDLPESNAFVARESRRPSEPLFEDSPSFLSEHDKISRGQSSPISTGRYFNQWTLHYLQGSTLEIQHLKNYLATENVKLEQQQLRDFVIHGWTNDDSSQKISTAQHQTAFSFHMSLAKDVLQPPDSQSPYSEPLISEISKRDTHVLRLASQVGHTHAYVSI